jgi:hypothetical protein
VHISAKELVAHRDELRNFMTDVARQPAVYDALMTGLRRSNNLKQREEFKEVQTSMQGHPYSTAIQAAPWGLMLRDTLLAGLGELSTAQNVSGAAQSWYESNDNVIQLADIQAFLAAGNSMETLAGVWVTELNQSEDTDVEKTQYDSAAALLDQLATSSPEKAAALLAAIQARDPQTAVTLTEHWADITANPNRVTLVIGHLQQKLGNAFFDSFYQHLSVRVQRDVMPKYAGDAQEVWLRSL